MEHSVVSSLHRRHCCGIILDHFSRNRRRHL